MATNSYGYYNFPKLPEGNYFLIFRQVGYKTTIREVKLTYNSEKLVYSIGLQPESIKLKEVVITGQKQENATNVSTIDVSPDILSKLPSLTGEVDLFKLLQTLPGVGMASEISKGIYVRGGSPDQNLTLVDGVIVYNPSHLGNIASTFNSNAISNIKLIKGAYPAEYGGRLSSVLDIHLRSGTKEENKATLGLGLINSFATLEGPIGEKSTYMISGRTMYYNMLVNNFNKNSSIPRYSFSDLSSKITYSLSDISTLSISGLYSRDKITSPAGTEYNYDIEWSNEFLSFNWLHINKNSILLNSILSYIDYDFKSVIGLSPEQLTNSTYFASSRLRDIQLKEHIESKWNENNTLKSGLELTYHIYNLLYSNVYDSLLEDNPFAGNNLNSFESAVYLENESKITPLFTANIGARLYYFNLQKYFYAEPHISFKYALTENNFLKAAFATSHQYLHLIDRNDISLPTDLWYPSTKQILPAKSNEYVFGIDNYFSNQAYLLSLEGYYRDMKNLYEFKNNAVLNPFDNSIENQFVKGDGEAYGIELFFNKRKGNFNGWIGFTLSWTKRQFDALNAGKVFYPKYDRRHDISVVISYKFSDSFSAGLTWMYATGERYNLPIGQYIFQQV
ncbi:MAG: TonB-dependent receptor plug domain-containing protein, partial [Ignavibacteriaceae bacterium]